MASLADAAERADEVAIGIHATADRALRAAAAVIAVAGVLRHFANLVLLRIALAVTLTERAAGQEPALSTFAALAALAALLALAAGITALAEHGHASDPQDRGAEEAQRLAPVL